MQVKKYISGHLADRVLCNLCKNCITKLIEKCCTSSSNTIWRQRTKQTKLTNITLKLPAPKLLQTWNMNSFFFLFYRHQAIFNSFICCYKFLSFSSSFFSLSLFIKIFCNCWLKSGKKSNKIKQRNAKNKNYDRKNLKKGRNYKGRE